MSEWKECRLGDVAEFKNGKSRPSEMVNGTIPIYGGNGILGYTDTFNYQGETVIVGRVGAYCGSVFFENKPIWVSDNALYTIPKNETDAKFLYYLLKNMGLNSQAEGSSHPLLTQTLLNSLDVFVTDFLPEQRAIASVLSSLDDKIDLLHRQNKTLEGMAEVLWRKMFVEEADPGWREISLLEIIDLVGGGTPKTEVSEYWDGAVPWLSAKDITSNHKCFIVQTEKDISELGLKNSAAKILPQYATIISARGTVGNYCILSKPMAFSQSNYGVLPKIDGCFFFTYLLIAFIVDELKSAAYGSVFDTITTNTFREQKIILPSKDIILSFEKMINTYFEKIYNNTIQIRTLSRLRDTLLPKLMSGEVRMKI